MNWPSSTGSSERRKHVRVAVQLTGHFLRSPAAGGPEKISLVTRDVSTGGLYALTDESFATDERLVCILELTAGAPASQAPLLLRCMVRVVRVEPVDQVCKQFGVGLEIEGYSVMRDATHGETSNG